MGPTSVLIWGFHCITEYYTIITDPTNTGCMEHMRSKQVNDPQFKSLRISLLRSVFTVGVLCKFFDFDAIIPAPTGVSSSAVCPATDMDISVEIKITYYSVRPLTWTFLWKENSLLYSHDNLKTWYSRCSIIRIPLVTKLNIWMNEVIGFQWEEKQVLFDGHQIEYLDE